MANPRVYIFWDNSNIFVGAQGAGKAPAAFSHNVRIEFGNLYKLALCNRPLAGAHAVGSVPPQSEAVWKSFAKSTGIQPELFERGGSSRKEQAVDQALQVHILRALADEEQPQIAVLLTGDGAGFDTGVGFHADMQRMHKRGWGIEVISWEHTCAKGLRMFADEAGCFIRLDDYVESIAFEAGGDHAKPLNLRHRRTASVRQST